MTCCNHCKDAGNFFDNKTARKELKKYRKKGPWNSTRLLLSHIRSLKIQGKTLLDIGGGIGAIQHELFKDGLESATQVEASPAYIQTAEMEAERNGHQDKLTSYYGDFVNLAPELPGADIVTLDRVICCYPHMDQLIDASVSKSKMCCGVVYPRERWFMKPGAWLVNLFMGLKKKDFRIYIHPAKDIAARFKKQGFYIYGSSNTFFWQVEVYVKN